MSFDAGYYILKDKLAVPVDTVQEWAEWFEKADRRVQRTVVEGVVISTVFLAMNHNFSGGEPLLFETMVFADEGYSGTLDLNLALEEGQRSGFWGDCVRTSSWGEAEAAHKQIVAHITAGFERALEASSNAMYKLITENVGQFS